MYKDEIIKLLETSTISDHHKSMIRLFLPSMSEKELKKLHNALSLEKKKINKLEEKKKRIELKYKVMVEKLLEAQGNDKKSS